MADFVQVMKDWRRLCRTMEAEHPDYGCNHCPLLDLSPDKRGCDAIYTDEFADNVDWRELEKRVTKWAAEHPEPVYPTWAEWLHSLHVVGVHAMCAPEPNFYYPIDDKFNAPIPADIASKLGIQPKEAKE